VSRRRLLFAAALVLTACSDAARPSGPGAHTATVRSPHGAEGAAVLTLVGEGVLDVRPVGGTEVYSVVSGALTRVVLIDQAGGTLAFEVIVAELSRPLVALLQEVAGPDDELRDDLSGYRVELGG